MKLLRLETNNALEMKKEDEHHSSMHIFSQTIAVYLFFFILFLG